MKASELRMEGSMRDHIVIKHDSSFDKIDLSAYCDPETERQYDFMNTLISDHIRSATKQFDDHLKAYLKKNLIALGFEFESEAHFQEFIKTRITREGFADRPHYYELILDANGESGSGKFVGCYSDDCDVSYKDDGSGVSTMVITFGKEKPRLWADPPSED